MSVLETQPPKEAEDSDYFHRSTMLMQFARKSRRSTDTSSLSASQKRRKKVKSILVTEQKRVQCPLDHKSATIVLFCLFHTSRWFKVLKTN